MSKGTRKLTRSRPIKKARRELSWTRRRANYTLHDRLLSNRTAKKALRKRPPKLSPVQQEALDRLRADGIATVHVDRLLADQPLWSALASDGNRFIGEAQAELSRRAQEPSEQVEGGSDKDAYLIRRYPRISRRRRQQLQARGRAPADATLTPEEPLLRLGVSGAVLDVVNAYRGLQTKLVDLDQWYTIPVGGDADRVQSQKWHRDPEDLHVVKVFLYLSDVDEEAGPFEYLPGSQPGGRYGDLWPWRFRGDNYPSPEEMEERFPRDEHYTATGPRGTIILCDTSGFHRGGFARSKPRVLAVYTYVSPASLRSRKFRRFCLDGFPAELSEDASFALT